MLPSAAFLPASSGHAMPLTAGCHTRGAPNMPNVWDLLNLIGISDDFWAPLGHRSAKDNTTGSSNSVCCLPVRSPSQINELLKIGYPKTNLRKENGERLVCRMFACFFFRVKAERYALVFEACSTYECSAAKGLMLIPGAEKVGGNTDEVRGTCKQQVVWCGAKVIYFSKPTPFGEILLTHIVGKALNQQLASVGASGSRNVVKAASAKKCGRTWRCSRIRSIAAWPLVMMGSNVFKPKGTFWGEISAPWQCNHFHWLLDLHKDTFWIHFCCGVQCRQTKRDCLITSVEEYLNGGQVGIILRIS